MTASPIFLDCLPLIDKDSGDFNVVIETPKASRNKYKYDSAQGVMRLGATLAEGLVFPFDFGFFPSTRGDDGDPLDVLVLLDAGVPAGCVVTTRLIGALEVEQREKNKRWQRNDRFFAVAIHAHSHIAVHRLADLPSQLVPEVEAFFIQYAGLNGKELRVIRRSGRSRAHKLLKAGAKAFKGKQ